MQGLDVTLTDFFQFHEIENDNIINENSRLLEVMKSLLYNRPLEENKLVLRVVKDILETIDRGKS